MDLPSATHERRARAAGALRALAVANARYWPSVAPAVRCELARWTQPAASIADPGLRELALAKLAREHFNAEVAATLATLAPQARRADTATTIVALELLFDYLDGRTEQLTQDPIAEGAQLYGPFIASVEQPARDRERTAQRPQTQTPADWGYLSALSQRTHQRLFAMPGAAAVAQIATASAQRCAEAQTRLHAAASLGEGQLQRWAVEQARESGLEWRDYTAGCASSVLAIHALIAAAANPDTSREHAQRIDRAYLAIGAVITILDSVVDHTEDSAGGHGGFIGLYEQRELRERLCALTREALARAREAPNGDHHEMTLAGIVAYYTSHSGARAQHARAPVRAVRRELSPTIWPALGVMRCWRAAKRARRSSRAIAPDHNSRRQREYTDAHLGEPA
jgi:tetraprenyl-beta-curcumene synthase